MKHKFEFTDIDCLIILEALNYLIADKERHAVDRESARIIKYEIYEIVRKDKEDDGN